MIAPALAVLLLAVSAAPAAAGFRYVPPAEAEAAAAPAEGESGGAELEIGPATGPGRTVWRVHAGETLREALARWGARAGTDVLFLTDRRYRLEGAASFQGAFGEAAQALFRALAHLPHAPVGTLSEDGGSLAVTHRLPAPTPGGGKP